MALDQQGNPHIVWGGMDGGGNYRICYSRFTAGAWSTPEFIDDGVSFLDTRTPQIALDGNGNPHVAWCGSNGQNYDIYYTENTGSGWITPISVSGTSSSRPWVDMSPRLALDASGNPHVVWYGMNQSEGTYPIYYNENTGAGWGDPVAVCDASVVTDNRDPQLALDSGGKPHVAWWGSDGSATNVYYSENTGSGWSNPPAVLSTTSTSNDYTRIALDNDGNPQVIFEGTDGSSVRRLYYSRNDGSGWTNPPVMLSTTTTMNYSSQIAADASGNPNVVFRGNEGAANYIYYTRNTVSGWSDPPELIDTATTNNYDPQFALDPAGHPHVTWLTFNGSTSELYYSTNSGSGWSAPLNLCGSLNTDNYGQCIALDTAGYPHVAWAGYISDSLIYYTADARYVISASANPASGGTVTGAGLCEPGATVNVHAAPNPGYHFINWTEGGTPVSASADYSFPAAGDRALVGKFQLNSYAVIASVSGAGGTVSPATQQIDHGSSATVNIAADPGYQTHSVTDNGTPVSPTPTTSYAISNITADHNVVVTFTPDEEPTTIWYLAEGTNAWGFNTYITIENPNNEQVTARLTYMDPNPQSGAGVVGTRDVTLPPLSQTTVSSMPDIGNVDFSTKVECLQGKTIAVDRTMFWTGPGAPSPEGHSSIGTTTPSTTWYLPEGSSNWNFETWTLIENPGATDAHVKLTYMTETGAPQSFDRTVPAHCRATYNMASDIGSHDASLKVTSDLPVIAERSMYRNNRREGSCSIGATAPATDFFLAEGATGYDVGFTTYVLVQNPNDSDVQVTLTYQTQSGKVAGPSFTMPANSRKTVRANDQLTADTNVSTRVHGSKPIIAERSMYWGADTLMGEAMHASIGLDSPQMTFYLPDGQTSDGHETWALVQNPNPGAVTVRITYLPQGGGTSVSFTDEIGANTRSTYSMVAKLPSGRASIMVQSLDGARPIMVERSMYWNSRGAGTNTVGGFSD